MLGVSSPLSWFCSRSGINHWSFLGFTCVWFCSKSIVLSIMLCSLLHSWVSGIATLQIPGFLTLCFSHPGWPFCQFCCLSAPRRCQIIHVAAWLHLIVTISGSFRKIIIVSFLHRFPNLRFRLWYGRCNSISVSASDSSIGGTSFFPLVEGMQSSLSLHSGLWLVGQSMIRSHVSLSVYDEDVGSCNQSMIVLGCKVSINLWMSVGSRPGRESLVS